MLNPREPRALAAERFDVVVVGGGFHGIMAALEAVRRGLRPLLIERRDFGSGTSENSLRIVHGGLRYLQSLDVTRSLQSLTERRWFVRHFPDHARPLNCLLPLYNEGLRRPSAFRVALALNGALSWRRNVGVRPDVALPAGRVLSPSETSAVFPAVAEQGLVGAGVWHDAYIPNAPRMMIEALHWVCARGARVLNYVEAGNILTSKGRTEGIEAKDTLDGAELVFHAPVVINAAGPWVPAVAASTGARPETFLPPSLAWNVIIDRKPLSDYAVAVQPPRPGARAYFLVPWKGVFLAGTGHTAWTKGPEKPHPTPSQMEEFISDINEAVPSLNIGTQDIARVYAGLIPATGPGEAKLAVRHRIVDHGAEGGAKGLFSICGIKLTTSRYVADQVLRAAFPSARPLPYSQFQRPPFEADEHPDYPFSWMPAKGDNNWLAPLTRAISTEAVHHLDDLLRRRSSIGDNPTRALALAPEACQLFDWDTARREQEIADLRHTFGMEVAHP